MEEKDQLVALTEAVFLDSLEKRATKNKDAISQIWKSVAHYHKTDIVNSLDVIARSLSYATQYQISTFEPNWDLIVLAQLLQRLSGQTSGEHARVTLTYTLGVDEKVAQTVKRLCEVRHTAKVPSDYLERGMRDINLIRLAFSWEEFVEMQFNNVKRHKGFPSSKDFYLAQIKYFEWLLKTPKVYTLVYFYHQYGNIAQTNLENYIDMKAGVLDTLEKGIKDFALLPS